MISSYIASQQERAEATNYKNSPAMKKLNLITLVIFLIASTFTVFAQEKSKVASTNYNALELRNVSTGFASGRIADIAIHPENENVWYVAVGSGGVWKTENASITWKPILTTNLLIQ